MTVKARLWYDITWDKTQLFVFQEDYSGAKSQLLPAKFEMIKPDHIKPRLPFLDDNAREIMQAILDECWEKGMRPNNFADHTHELTATRSHLQDMRALVFKTGKPG